MFLLIGHSNRVRRSEAISIHLMFLLISGQRMHYRIKSNYFNTSHVSINRKSGGQDHSRRNFNTSHVSINPGNARTFPVFCSDFNTSHVSINQKLHCFSCRGRANFNTSHVSINPCGRRFPGSCGSISIHLMFLLILLPNGNRFVLKPFQYISCFY